MWCGMASRRPLGRPYALAARRRLAWQDQSLGAPCSLSGALVWLPFSGMTVMDLLVWLISERLPGPEPESRWRALGFGLHTRS